MPSQTDRSALTRPLRPIVLACALAVGGLTGGCGDTISRSVEPRRAGITLFNQGRYEEAVAAFNTATRNNPRDHVSHYYLGLSYERAGDYLAAIQSYKTSLAVMPMGLSQPTGPEFRDEVEDALARAVAKSPTRDTELNALQQHAEVTRDPRDWSILAKAHIAAGDPDSAIDAWQRAVAADPRNFKVLRTYGLWLESMGLNKDAEMPLRRAYALNDKDETVIAALRRIGVVVGPSLKEPDELARPIIPRGPLPEIQLWTGNNAASSDR